MNTMLANAEAGSGAAMFWLADWHVSEAWPSAAGDLGDATGAVESLHLLTEAKVGQPVVLERSEE